MLGIKTIDGILKNFNKTVSDLRGIAEVNSTKITRTNEEIMSLKEKVTTASDEKNKATNIADKLEALISGE